MFALRHVELVTGLIARKKVAQHTTAPQSHQHTCTAVCECAECVCVYVSVCPFPLAVNKS